MSNKIQIIKFYRKEINEEGNRFIGAFSHEF